MPDFPPSPIFTIRTYDVDGDFAKDESLIGGPVSINGIFLMAYISKLEVDDGDGNSEFYINEKNVASTGFYRDHEYEGLMASKESYQGTMSYFDTQTIETPHTSFDIKSWETGTWYFHRTYKVIIINRTA